MQQPCGATKLAGTGSPAVSELGRLDEIGRPWTISSAPGGGAHRNDVTAAGRGRQRRSGGDPARGRCPTVRIQILKSTQSYTDTELFGVC